MKGHVRHISGEEGVVRPVAAAQIEPEGIEAAGKTVKETGHPDVPWPEGAGQTRWLEARDQAMVAKAVTGNTGLVGAGTVQGLVAVAPQETVQPVEA